MWSTFRDLHLHRTIQRRDANGATQYRLRIAYVDLAVEVCTASLEEGVLFDVDDDEEVAIGAFALASVALARETLYVTFLDACGNAKCLFVSLAKPACAMAMNAGILDDLTLALTGRTRPSDGEETLRLLHLPMPVASGTCAGACACFCTRAGAALTTSQAFDLDRLLDTAQHFFEIEVQIDILERLELLEVSKLDTLPAPDA